MGGNYVDPAYAVCNAMAKSLEFQWKWIDRLARGETTLAEALSVLTHHPDAPGWVKRVPDEPS